MSQPASQQNEPGKLNRLVKGRVNQAFQARIPREGTPSSKAPALATVTATTEPAKKPDSGYKFWPAFWTVASVMSLTVNVVLLAIGLLALRMLGGLQFLAQDQAAGVLGGLYHNFVKMDQATISANIPVDAMIPLNIVVPVQTTTRITLAEQVSIPNAHVRINTGALNIDANAEVTLPADTPLTVKLDFPLNVQNNIPVHLDVPVNIPLSQTQLHEPFVGLQKVVEPFYCFIEPNVTVNGVNVCSPTVINQNPVEQIIP